LHPGVVIFSPAGAFGAGGGSTKNGVSCHPGPQFTGTSKLCASPGIIGM
jgi:hypothetical protein